MRSFLIIICIIFFANTTDLNAQKKRRHQTSGINFFGQVNVNPSANTYNWDLGYYDYVNLNYIKLDYITRTSGTFTVGLDTNIVHTKYSFVPNRQRINLGFGIQKEHNHGKYWELSLSKFSTNKNSIEIERDFYNSDTTTVDYQQMGGFSINTFEIAMRYEFGKYFGEYTNDFKLGLGIGIEPQFISFKSQPVLTIDLPYQEKILETNLICSNTFFMACVQTCCH